MILLWNQCMERKDNKAVLTMTKGVFMKLPSGLISVIWRKSSKARISKPEPNTFDDTQMVATWSTACCLAPVKVSLGRLVLTIGSSHFQKMEDLWFHHVYHYKFDSIDLDSLSHRVGWGMGYASISIEVMSSIVSLAWLCCSSSSWSEFPLSWYPRSSTSQLCLHKAPNQVYKASELCLFMISNRSIYKLSCISPHKTMNQGALSDVTH